MRFLPSSLVLVVLCCSPLAQSLHTVTGTVVSDANACDPAAFHRLECSDLSLRSSVLDLEVFVGQVVTITGQVSATGDGCVSLDVKQLESAQRRMVLTASEGFRPGRSIIVTTQAEFGADVYIAFSPTPAFVPFASFGVLLLEPTSTWVDPDPVSSLGVALRSYTVPNTPAVVGCSIVMQSISVQMSPMFDVELLNPACFTIVP